nr:NAD(P)/FAD-dependent oxidoreductase [Maliibacterium massiliense]
MTQDRYDVVIIGAGPAGIFTALELMRTAPKARVLIVERGRQIAKRTCPARTTGKCVHCDPCAIMCGWSGAGAFSDGKLSLSEEVGGALVEYLPRKDVQELIQYADSIYLEFGARKEVHGLSTPDVERIAYEAARYNIQLIPCPIRHLGTDGAYQVLSGMYDAIAAHDNITFMERTDAVDLLRVKERVCGVRIKQAGAPERDVYAPFVVAAPGRGGAQWLSETARRHGILTTNNAVDIGVRVEVPNAIMDHLTRYLYEAKLVYYSDTFENKVRTFCMNPGGVVSEEHYEGGLAVVNGHSYGDAARRTENTNFAILVSNTFTEPFDEPIEYGRYIARLGNMLTGGHVMVQRLGDLLAGRRTTAKRIAKSTTRVTLETAVPGDLSFMLPHRHLTSIIETLKAFDHIAPGLFSRNTLLYGAEVKFYSSKLKVAGDFQTPLDGLYAAGDGAGITRGLMQASVNGVVVARSIAARL